MTASSTDARRALLAVGIALASALFFTLTYVLNRASASGGGHWAWTACLRYFITLPLLLPTLVTAMVLRSVDLLRFFDLIYITTQGGPSDHSMTLNIYGFRTGFEFFQLGYAGALMVTLSVLVLGAVIALNRLRAAVEW